LIYWWIGHSHSRFHIKIIHKRFIQFLFFYWNFDDSSYSIQQPTKMFKCIKIEQYSLNIYLLILKNSFTGWTHQIFLTTTKNCYEFELSYFIFMQSYVQTFYFFISGLLNFPCERRYCHKNSMQKSWGFEFSKFFEYELPNFACRIRLATLREANRERREKSRIVVR